MAKAFIKSQNHIMANMLQIALEKAEVQTERPLNSESFLKKETDILLFHEEGFQHETVKAARRYALLNGNGRVPIIFLREKGVYLQEPVHMGIDAFITTPVSMEILLEFIQKSFKNAKDARNKKWNDSSGDNLDETPLKEALQILDLNGRDGILELKNGSNDTFGEFHIKNGLATYAHAGPFDGESAIFSHLETRAGFFRFKDQKIKKQKNIRHDSLRVLHELALFDERLKPDTILRLNDKRLIKVSKPHKNRFWAWVKRLSFSLQRKEIELMDVFNNFKGPIENLRVYINILLINSILLVEQPVKKAKIEVS